MLYKEKEVSFKEGWEVADAVMKENFENLMKCDEEAKNKGELVGRVVRHQIADGYAWYQVIKEATRTCTIRVCRGLGDDWVIPAWGEQSSVSKSKILGLIEWEDRMKALFGGKA